MRKYNHNNALLITIYLGLTIVTNTVLYADKSKDPSKKGNSYSEKNTIIPNEKYQTMIHSLLKEATTREDVERRINKLINDVGPANITHLVEQALFCVQNAKDKYDKVTGGYILRTLAKEKKGAYVWGILPYIGSNDTKLVSIIKSTLAEVDHTQVLGIYDFGYYQSALGSLHRKNITPPSVLIQHMFERSPGLAVLCCARVYANNDIETLKEILWAEHVVSDVLWKQQHGFIKANETEPAAMEQLDKLSQHKAWWARLYVAEILRQHPEFKTVDIVKRLESDENELVQQAMKPKPAPTTQPTTQPAS